MMKQTKYTRFLTFTVLVLLLFAFPSENFAQKKGPKKDKKKNAAQVEDQGIQELEEEMASGKLSEGSKKAMSESMFIEGMKHFILHDYKSALPVFVDAEKLDPSEATINYLIATCHLKLNQHDRALPFAEKAIQLDNSNEYFYVLLVDVYRQKNQYGKVVEVYKDLLKNTKGTEEHYLDLAAAYMNLSKYEAAIDTYNESEAKYGVSEMIVRQKQRIYLNLENIEAAITEGGKLIDAFPGVTEYVLTQAQLLISGNKITEAVNLLEALSAENPEDTAVKVLLADIYRIQGREQDYNVLLEEAFSSPSVSFDQKMNILNGYLQYSQRKDKRDSGVKLAKIALELEPDNPKANELYAEFMLVSQRQEEARHYFSKSLRLNSDNYPAWERLISLDWEMNEIDSMLAHSETALEIFPNQVVLYLYNGLGQTLKNNHEEAAFILEQGKHLVGTDEMAVQFSSQLGDTYYKLGEYEKAYTAYEDALALEPDNLYVLNNYSYYLSLRKEKLSLAKQMGEKLVQAEPDNPTYLDTYGWILYTAGDYKKAREVLHKAAENTQSAVIAEHYGDVLYKLGEKEAAFDQWMKAKVLGGDKGETGKLEQKIAERKLVE